MYFDTLPRYGVCQYLPAMANDSFVVKDIFSKALNNLVFELIYLDELALDFAPVLLIRLGMGCHFQDTL